MVKQRRDISAISKIIIHCSDSDNPAHDDISVIRKWHIEDRHFLDVGYHYFIKKNGEIQKGRELYEIGAHCEKHNIDSIGICFSGKEKFPWRQLRGGVYLIRDLCDILGLRKRYRDSKDFIFPHHFFDPSKTCPNFDIQRLFDISNHKCNNKKQQSNAPNTPNF